MVELVYLLILGAPAAALATVVGISACLIFKARLQTCFAVGVSIFIIAEILLVLLVPAPDL
jgi:hypothetical protein